MSCFRCKRTGEKICDAAEAEIRCMVCGFCERKAIKDQFEEGANDGMPKMPRQEI